MRLIESYEPVFNDRKMPRPVLPPQDSAPWLAGVRTLTANKARYEEEQRAQQQAALHFVAALDRFAFEKLLLSLSPLHETSRPAQSPESSSLENLSDQKRRVIAETSAADLISQSRLRLCVSCLLQTPNMFPLTAAANVPIAC